MKTLLCFLTLLAASALPLQAADRPNIVLIMADDFGYECVTANGGESYQTPALDALAASGVRFENCHTTPLCTPTRVQLMTGRYNVRNYLNFGTLPKGETTFARLLKDAGYATGICGKWQLGAEKGLPQHFGFDESCLWQHTRRPPRYANPGLEYNGEPRDFAQGEYGPKLINDFALDFIARHRQEAFFLYYPMILTHDPFQPTPDSPDWDPKAVGEKVNQHNKHFGEMTAYMDQMIGRVVGKLEELGLRENTLILFLGDNGTHSRITSRFKGADYQGGKGTTTAHGTHVPLIASWPARIKEARVSPALVSTADFLPTLCDAAGVPVPGAVDGLSFLHQIESRAGADREWIYTWYSPRQRQDLTVREFVHDTRFKLYRDGAFYDLSQDPLERQPLALSDLNSQGKKAADRFQKVLSDFANARPAGLDEAFLRSGAPPPKKRGGGKKKTK